MGSCNDGYGDGRRFGAGADAGCVGGCAERDGLPGDLRRGAWVRCGVRRYGASLDEFATLVASQFSKAAWSKYHRGELELNWTMQRAAAGGGMPVLPLTVVDAVAGVTRMRRLCRSGRMWCAGWCWLGLGGCDAGL